MDPTTPSFSAFSGQQRIAQGDLLVIVRTAYALRNSSTLVLNDLTGERLELDLRGALDEALARVTPSADPPPRPTRGRPKLGVTAREVTLLPRHWDWLAAQPGGASAALRRLVEEARRDRDRDGADAARRSREAAYRAMTLLAGDLPNYEEATRALFAGDTARVASLIGDWPDDVRNYLGNLISRISA